MNWWHFKYVGQPLPLVGRIKVWFYLRRVERLVKRQMIKDMGAGKVWKREHVLSLVEDAKKALRLEED